MKKVFTAMAKLAAGVTIGYILSHHVSHPRGRARRHMPIFRVGRVQLMPNLLIATKNTTWHIHHWAYLPTIYLPLLVLIRKLLRRNFLHGMVLGSIIHGLTYKDRFRFSR